MVLCIYILFFTFIGPIFRVIMPGNLSNYMLNSQLTELRLLSGPGETFRN